MSDRKLTGNLEIAPRYSIDCWKGLRTKLDPDAPDTDEWREAIGILASRLRSRFLDPVDRLIALSDAEPSTRFGFAILAVDLLVVETLQGFREGEIEHQGRSKRLFKNFLAAWSEFNRYLPKGSNPDEIATLVYKGYRCALHHSGATDHDFRIGRRGATFGFNGNSISINRTCFQTQLKQEFEHYLQQLQAPSESVLRRNFKRKMDAICGIVDR